jgi:hypothetical protein
MTILAYLITFLIVPVLATFSSNIFLLFFVKFDKDFLPFITTIIGIITGYVSVVLGKLVFGWFAVEFTSAPVWILFVMYLLNDLRRVGGSMSEIKSIIEVGQLIGTPIGLYWAF